MSAQNAEASNVRTLALLQQVPIFGALRPDALAFLLDLAERIEYAAGETVFEQRDLGDGVYVIESGEVDIVKSCAGGDLHLRTLGRGDCFGEIALLAMIPRTATVRATSALRTVRLHHEHFQRLYGFDLEQFTILVMNLSREVCRRLERADDLLFRFAPDAARREKEEA
jgi:CRP/FNR family cyclic AMP-dependent transcriptional regulator